MRSDVGLAGARGPLHGKVAVVEVEDGAHDRVDVVACGCRQPAAPRARRQAPQDIGRRVGGEVGRGCDDRIRPCVDRDLLVQSTGRRRRCQGDRQLGPREAVDGGLLDECSVVEHLDHRHPVVGMDPPHRRLERERRRQFVQCERVGPFAEPRPGGELPAQLDDAPVGACALRAVPVLHKATAGVVEGHHVARLLPQRDGFAKSEEVRRPERLRLARVVVDPGRAQAERHRLGGIHGVLQGERRQLDSTRRWLVDVLARLRVRRRAQPRLARMADEPVAQAQRRHAVIAVVVGQVVEDLLCRGARAQPRRAVATVIAQCARLDVPDDRVVALLHVAGAHLVAHVQRLELLDGVGPRADTQSAADDGVEIDEHAVAQQTVDIGLARPVSRRHRQQMGRLVRRVVVDVHVGMLHPLQIHDVEEALEGHPLLLERMGPQGAVLLADVDPAEQVVDAPDGGIRLRVERVALEVEEHVARIRARQSPERLRRHDLVRRDGGRLAGVRGHGVARPRRRAQLKPGLRLQHRERVGVHPGGSARRVDELVDRHDPGCVEPISLHGAHARHQEQVASGHDLGVARRTAPARHHSEVASRIAPGDRRPPEAQVEPTIGDQRLEAGSAEREDGQQFLGDVHADRSVAEQQLDPIRTRNTEPVELIDVCRKLHQGCHAGAASELAVLHDPAAILVTHQEVGEADELVSRERRLIDHVGVRGERRLRERDRLGQAGGVGGVASPGSPRLPCRTPPGNPRAPAAHARRPAGPRARGSRLPAPRPRRRGRSARRCRAARRTRTPPRP